MTPHTPLAALLALFAASTALGDGPTSPETAAYQCARVLFDQTGTGRYELIRMTEPGRRHYRFWMNAHDESIGGYCSVRRDQVTEAVVNPSPWEGRLPGRPDPLENSLACAADVPL